MKKIKGIVFDLDGTVVDSKLDFDLMRKDIGMPKSLSILEYLEKSKDRVFIVNAFEIIHRHELKGAEESTIIADFLAFYDFLKTNNILIGILTRNSKEVADFTLKKHNLIFNDVLSRDCCKAKPDPEGLNLLIRKWGLNKDEVLYVGDYLFDLETANNAGVKGGLILNDRNEEFKVKANFSFRNFKELFRFF